LDAARISIPPLDGLEIPQLRAVMLALESELTTDARGGRLAVESLVNVLGVQLIRQTLSPYRPDPARKNALSQKQLRAVMQYIEEHLEEGLTLEQMAAKANLSPYHFARQFKEATGMPPHQYVISRRVERAQNLLRPDNDLSLGDVAYRAGFSDQSQFSHH